MSEAKPESEGSAGSDEKKPNDGTTPEKNETPSGEEAKKDEAKEGEKTDYKKQDEKTGDKPGEETEKKLEEKVGDKLDTEKKEGDKKEEKKDEAKPEEEKTEEKKGEKPDTEKKDGDKKEEKKGDEKDEAKPEAKKDEKMVEMKSDKPDAEKKEVDKKEEKKDEEKFKPATPTITDSSTTATTTPSTTPSTAGTSMVGGPTVTSGPKVQPKIFTSPLAGRLGRKVDPKDLRPAEALIKTRERGSEASSKDGKERSSSGSTTLSSTAASAAGLATISPSATSASSMATLKGSALSSSKMFPNILENTGAVTILDEDYLKKNKDVIVLRDREIATGTYSSYYRVKLRSGKDQAVKILKLMNATQTYKENLTSQSSKIMRWLISNPHDSIVKPFDLFITTQSFYMFVPNYSFGNLESLVTPKSAPNEAAIKKLMKQIAAGMQFLVSNTIAHRAIKTTHGVFSTADKKQVKLCGFGNAVVAKSNGAVQLQKKIIKDNFIPYMAPEVLKADYDPFIADVFSFGAMIIALLTKRYPFGPYKQSLKQTDTWRQHFQRFGVKPSKDLEDLIDKIVAEPQSRISLDELLKHKWFNA